MYMDITCSAPIQPYTDCERMLRLLTTAPLTRPASNPILPDHDITSSLHHWFGKLSERCATLKPGLHVKAHQKPPLPNRQAVLIQFCDSKAKHARTQHTIIQPLPLPTCNIYVLSKQRLLTSGELNTARWQWRNSDLLNFYAKKFSAPMMAVQRINWESYGKCKTALPPHLKKFITKLTVRWLPSASRLHMCGNETNTCSLCPSVETNHHIFQCSHRIPTFLTRHKDFTAYLESIQTPPDTTLALTTGILHWAVQASATARTAATQTLTIHARLCYQQQTAIGWDLATFGMMDDSWARTIPDPNLSGTGEKWQTKVTKWLIDSAYRIWVQRNTERYTPNQADALGAQLLETQAQIRKVYALAENNLTIHDRHELIKETLAERLTLPENTNRLWATQLLRLIYTRIKHNSTRPHLTDIRQFFPPKQK